MGEGTWFRRRRRTPVSKRSRSEAKRGFKPRGLSLHRPMSLEHLEDRRLLVNYLVSVAGDVDGDDNAIFGTLRWAIDQANASEEADVIVFAENLTAIGLNGGEITIESPLRILGPGPRKLTVAQGRPNQRIFTTDIGDDDEFFFVEISGMTLSGGNLTGDGDDQRGGAVFNREVLTMNEVIVTNNSAAQGGGGIYVERGSLTLSRSLVANNFAGFVGGGIMIGNDDEDVAPGATIVDSTITGNTAAGTNDTYPMSYGGGIFLRGPGGADIISCTITENNADVGGGVASWGIPVEDGEEPPPPPDPNQFILSSIVWGNMADDVAVVGFSDDEEMPIPITRCWPARDTTSSACSPVTGSCAVPMTCRRAPIRTLSRIATCSPARTITAGRPTSS